METRTEKERGVVGLPEAAYRLRRSYQTAWTWLLAGKIEGTRVGDRWMVYEDQLPAARAEEGAAR